MIRVAALVVAVCAIPSFAQAQSFRVTFPAPVIVRPAPVVVAPPVVVRPAPVIVQRPIIVTPAPVVPVVAQYPSHYPVQPAVVCYEVFVRNSPFGFWESAGVYHSQTEADIFASRMELRGYEVRVRVR